MPAFRANDFEVYDPADHTKRAIVDATSIPTGTKVALALTTSPPASHDHTGPTDGGVLTNDAHDGFSDYAVISTPASPGAGTSRLYAESQNGFPVIQARDSTNTSIRLHRDNFYVAKVKETGGITKGQAVYLSGGTGANEEVKLARANAIDTMPCAGLALDTGALNDFIRVTFSGKVGKLDTTAPISLPDGAIVYVSELVAGRLTNVKPATLDQQIGICTRNDTSNGEILVLLRQVGSTWAAVNLTAQTANIGITGLLVGPPAGLYHFDCYLLCTTADVTAGTLAVNAYWSDNVGAVLSTPISAFPLTTTGRTTGKQLMRVASGDIEYSVVITGAYNNAQYAIYVRVSALG